MAKNRVQHHKNPKNKSDSGSGKKVVDQITARVHPTRENIIHVCIILGAIGAVVIALLAVSRHWLLLAVAAFLTITSFLVALFLKFERPLRWKGLATSIVLAACLCLFLYKLILQDQPRTADSNKVNTLEAEP